MMVFLNQETTSTAGEHLLFRSGLFRGLAVNSGLMAMSKRIFLSLILTMFNKLNSAVYLGFKTIDSLENSALN